MRPQKHEALLRCQFDRYIVLCLGYCFSRFEKALVVGATTLLVYSVD